MSTNLNKGENYWILKISLLTQFIYLDENKISNQKGLKWVLSSIVDRIDNTNFVFWEESNDLFTQNREDNERIDEGDEFDLWNTRKKRPKSEMVAYERKEERIGDFLEPWVKETNKNFDWRKVITDLSQLAEESSQSNYDSNYEEDRFDMLNRDDEFSDEKVESNLYS